MIPPLPTLDRDEIQRYSRHLIMPEVGMEGQLKLKRAKVLLVGTGGLGETDQLPAAGFDPSHVRMCDIWGSCAAQIFAPVSPAMQAFSGMVQRRVALSRVSPLRLRRGLGEVNDGRACAYPPVSPRKRGEKPPDLLPYPPPC